MGKVAQKFIKTQIESGMAENVTCATENTIEALHRDGLIETCYSVGVYGCNGAMWLRKTDGKKFAVVGRCNNLFRLL